MDKLMDVNTINSVIYGILNWDSVFLFVRA